MNRRLEIRYINIQGRLAMLLVTRLLPISTTSKVVCGSSLTLCLCVHQDDGSSCCYGLGMKRAAMGGC